MPDPRKQSPTKSQGATPTSEPGRPRRSHSLGSPALSDVSGRLSATIQVSKERNLRSFVISPMVRKSILTDTTDIAEPRRQSWWKKLDENSINVMDVMEVNNGPEPNNILEELDIEVLSQEKKNYTLDLPESSDSESISSIVIPQRKLFTEKENVPQKNFVHTGQTRDTSKLQKTNAPIDEKISAGTRALFANKPRSKPIFPAALLNISPNKTTGDKTLTAAEPKDQVRKIFGNNAGTKRKNMFANFVVSESEDEIPEIQPKIFGFQKKPESSRHPSMTPRQTRNASSNSSVTTDIEFDDWKLLASSTMVENQFEAMIVGGQTPKRARLSKLTEGKESDAGTNNTEASNKTKHSIKSITKEQSPVQNTSIKNRSKLSQTEVTKFNKSQEKQHKSQILSPRNEKDKSLQSSIITRSKNKSSLNNISPKQTIYDKDLDTKNNKSKSKIISTNLLEQKQDVINSENGENIPMELDPVEQDNDDELNFTLKYDNNDENDMDKKANSQNTSNIEKSNKEKNKSPSSQHSLLQAKSVNINNDNMIIENNNKERQEKDNEMQLDDLVKEMQMRQEDHERKNNNDNDSKMENEQIEISQVVNVNENQEPEQSEKMDLVGDEEQENLKEDIEEGSQEEENESQLEQNESQVIQNESQLEQNESQVIQNESLLEQNKSQVIQNESQSEQNESQVIQNESQMEQNEIQVIQNERQSEQNESQVIQNESQLEQNESQVIQNESQLEQNESQEDTIESETEQNENQDSQNVTEEEDEEEKSINETENEENQEATEDEQQNSSQEEIEQDEQVDQEIENDFANDSASEVAESDQDESNQEIEASDNDSPNEYNQDENTDEIATDTPNISHDTTGRNRKKYESPEAVLQVLAYQNASFDTHGQNSSQLPNQITKTTSLKQTKSITKYFNVRPSLEPTRESIGLSDGTKNSSAEGSGWDSHRTTRKTLRQTFGKDFSLRKSLRALVMEKSAKRQTTSIANDVTSVTAKFPVANSTELPDEFSQRDDFDADVEPQESDHEISRTTRRTMLESYLDKIKKQRMENEAKMEQEVRHSLKAPARHTQNPFNVPKPMFLRRPISKTTKPRAKPVKSFIPFEELPAHVIQDMKYKPPKRFQPSNAPWITKRLYKYLESKLEPKYDYKARVRSEKFVETLYHFSKEVRSRDGVASTDAVEVLKHEMARLDIVQTHFEFYDFFYEFMPREIRVKVIPDVVNRIPEPRGGVFADILKENNARIN